MISACRKHVVAATGPPHLGVRVQSAPKSTMSGAAKPSPESSVPDDSLTWGSRQGNQLRRGTWESAGA